MRALLLAVALLAPQAQAQTPAPTQSTPQNVYPCKVEAPLFTAVHEQGGGTTVYHTPYTAEAKTRLQALPACIDPLANDKSKVVSGLGAAALPPSRTSTRGTTMNDGQPSGRMAMSRDPHFDPNSNRDVPLDAAFDQRAATAQVKDTLQISHEARTMAKQHSLARAAYNAYAEATGGKTFDGRQMPAFEELGERITNAWISAAEAARSHNA